MPSKSLGLMPVALETFCPASSLDFDLYLKSQPSTPAVLYRERGFPLKVTDLDRLRKTGVETLYVPVSDHSQYRKYLFEEVLPSERVPPELRHQLLTKAHEKTFQAAAKSRGTNKIVQFATEFSSQAAEIVRAEDFLLRNVFSLMQHDYYTYTHVTNVCTFSLALSIDLGVTDKQRLNEIATGALLHDLGKRDIPESILNKTGRLTDDDWRAIRRHPHSGFADLCLRPDLNWGQLMMVYQHHERLDGRGYPAGVGDRDVHPWARICSVVDVFDALTSERPYRKPMPVSEALALLHRDAGSAFDKEIVQCWTSSVKRQA